MRTVKSVKPLDDYMLLVEFDSGERRMCDIKPLLLKPVFAFLADKAKFDNAYVEYGAVTWKDSDGNEVDICPDKMYMDSLKV